MSRTLKIRVLGRFEARWSDGEAVELKNKKAQALLAYLAVEHGRTHSRDKLATLLWEDLGDDRARHNLRQALSSIRRICPALIDAGADSLSISPGDCEPDVAEFVRLAVSDDPAELRQALDLYRGELLEGSTPREEAYVDWLRSARDRLARTACDIAARLAAALRAAGRDREAIDALNDLLAIDPSNEPAHRDLMNALAAAGRRSDALRQYQTCVDALRRELGVAPSAETRDLHARLIRAAPPAAEREAPASAGAAAAGILYAGGVQHDTGRLADVVESAGGRIVQRDADTALACFDSATTALTCAFELQESVERGGKPAPGSRQSRWRIGIHCAGLPVEHMESAGALIAARLQALAAPGGVCVSGAVRQAAGESSDFDFAFIGEQGIAGLDQPARAYRVTRSADDEPAVPEPGTRDPGGAIPLPGKPSLVVKPFANISADPEQDYFAEGLTKDISIALVKIPGLFLAMDETPAHAKSRTMSARELGNEFGVRFVLTGGVRKQGGRVRVNAELIEAATGRCAWAERFDRNLEDLFAIQDEIAEEIVTAMDIKLIQGEPARFMRKALTNPAALEAAYRGWYCLYHGRGRQDIRDAQRLFEDVIRLEPEASIGYASAALAHWAEAGFGKVVSGTPAMERAAALAKQALDRGDTTGFANLILAIDHLGRHEYDEAMAQATDGVVARPSCNGAYAIKSSVLNYLGRPEEAVEFAEYAVRLTPVYPAEFPAILATACHDSGRFDEAVAAARASLALRPDDLDPLLILAASCVALGRMDEAREAARNVQKINPDFSLEEFASSQPYRDPARLRCLVERLAQAGLGRRATVAG